MKLLIVDDDQVSRESLRDLIGRGPEMEVTEADDGQKALDILCDGLRPDLCIIDLKMPKMSGTELIQRMRRDPELKNLKVVVSSATRDRDVIVTLAKLQISGYVLKPYDSTKTRATLQALLPTRADPNLAARNLLHRTVLVVGPALISESVSAALKKSEPDWDLVVDRNSEEALQRLQGGFRPELVIIDLTAGNVGGSDLLQRLQGDPNLRKLRVAVATDESGRARLSLANNLGLFAILPGTLDAETVRALFKRTAA
ncbi:MAG TPA: response regulator [Opitutaceae bacterium]|nr:response regulator [Opitutaceae bacterium]